MARIDDYFISMCDDILKNGTTTQGQKVRPHWPDGTPAYTIKKFGVVTRYNLQEEFPVLTLRRTPVKSALDELLWIWQAKSNDIHELHSGVWDEWADPEGSIGRAYGYQMAVKHRYYDIKEEGLRHAFGDEAYEAILTAPPVPDLLNDSITAPPCVSPGNAEAGTPETGAEGVRTEGKSAPSSGAASVQAARILPSQRPDSGPDQIVPRTPEERKLHALRGPDGSFYMDQVDRVIYDLKNNPYSRRIMTNIYTYSDLHAMNLYPCAYSMTFNVTQQPGHDLMTLNGIMNQRSQDILTAFAWNEWQYAALLALIAQSCGMEAGEFVHVVADAHIYDRHVGIVKELMSRTPQPAPKVWINPDVHDFYQFSRDDVKLEGYQVAGEQIRNIPVAI